MQSRRIKDNEKHWSVWEEEVAQSINSGNLVKASGRLDMFKGDVKTDELIVDCKYTNNDAFVISFDLFTAIKTWAINEMRAPALAICIDPENKYGQLDQESIHKIAVVPAWFYNELDGLPMSTQYEEEPVIQSSKTIGKKIYKDGKHHRFYIGNKFRKAILIALPFDEFVEMVNRYEDKKERPFI